MSETHGRKERPDILQRVPGYELRFCERGGTSKGGGGLALFFRESLSAHEWIPSVDDDLTYVEKERQWLLIHGEGGGKLAFLSCYIACHSFTSDDFVKWNEDLFHLLTKETLYLRQKGFMVVAMGDFNTRVGELNGLEGNTSDVNRNYPMFTTFTTETNLFIINTLPLCTSIFTRFEGDKKSLLDYGMVDGDHVGNILSFTIDENARFDCNSDHALLECEVLFRTIPKAHRHSQDIIRYNFHEKSDFFSYKTLLEESLCTINLDHFSHLSSPLVYNDLPCRNWYWPNVPLIYNYTKNPQPTGMRGGGPK